MFLLLFVVLVVLIGALVLWIVVVQHKKGDFLFRIKKLQHRSATVLSDLMDLRKESEYLVLNKDKISQQRIAKLEEFMDEANEKLVSVAEELQSLHKRAVSFFDFADLYVFIGMQEEQLEDAEAVAQKAKTLYKQLTQDENK